MVRRAKGSTEGTNGSASESRDGSDSSESTLRDDATWNGDRASAEREPAQEVQEFQEDEQFQADQVYENTHPIQGHWESAEDHRRSSASSSPTPMNRFLRDQQVLERFLIGEETTGNGGLEGSEQSVLPELDLNTNYKTRDSGTAVKSNEHPIGRPSSREVKECNNARSVDEPKPLKKRKRDKNKTGKAGKKESKEESSSMPLNP